MSDLCRIKQEQHFFEFLRITPEDYQSISTFDPNAPAYVEKTIYIDDDHTRPMEVLVPNATEFMRHTIEKRRAGQPPRTVWEAYQNPDFYKRTARLLELHFRSCLEGFPHPSSNGYSIGKSIRDNALPHLGQKCLMSFDIKEFFNSIDINQVENLFLETGVSPIVSNMLSRVLTIGGKLPLGLATSPSISNAIFHTCDFQLLKIADDASLKYSRYADDITFSGLVMANLEPQLSEVLAQKGFVLSPEKTRKSVIGQAHYVTGLSVSDPKSAHVPRKMKRKLRQILHFAQTYGLDDHLSRVGKRDIRLKQAEINRIDGLVRYVSFHEATLRHRLKGTWRKILDESGWTVSYEPKNQKRLPFDAYIDETEFSIDGQNFLMIGMSVTQSQERLNEVTTHVCSSYLADPHSDGDKEKIEKNGLHFADATVNLKLKYVESLELLKFEVIVGYCKIDNPREYRDKYLHILNLILPRRMMSAESQKLSIYIEKNEKIPEAEIRGLINKIYNSLERQNNRRPAEIATKIVGKEALGVSVPDFALGLIRAKLMETSADNAKRVQERLMFERLRDHIKLVIDFDTGIEYSRRNPVHSLVKG